MTKKDDKNSQQSTLKPQCGETPSMKRSQDESQSANQKHDADQPVVHDDRPWQEVIRERLGDVSWERMSGSAEKK